MPAKGLRVKYGFKIGVNYANLNFNKGYPKPLAPVESSWKKGVILGLLLQVPVYKRFSIQQEYLFAQIRGENKSLEINYLFTYISLPVLLQYKILGGFSLVVGPQFDLLIQAKEQTNSSNSNITHDTEARNIGVTAGLEYGIFKHLNLNARFMHGFNRVGIMQNFSGKEFKYELLQLSADFKF